MDANTQARKIIETALAELMELGASHDSAATLLAIQGAASIKNAAYLEVVGGVHAGVAQLGRQEGRGVGRGVAGGRPVRVDCSGFRQVFQETPRPTVTLTHNLRSGSPRDRIGLDDEVVIVRPCS